jgi:hypothetical protein
VTFQSLNAGYVYNGGREGEPTEGEGRKLLEKKTDDGLWGELRREPTGRSYRMMR